MPAGRTKTSDAVVLGRPHTHLYDDDVFYLFLQKQNLGAKLHIYL
jgi:hypothetical protein